MSQLTILPDYFYAGHCTSSGSNKVWAACLAVEDDNSLTINENTAVIWLCVWGAHGSNLRVDPPQRLEMTKAKTLFQKKCNEKNAKAYHQVSFAPFIPSFGNPFGFKLSFDYEENQTKEVVHPNVSTPESFRYEAVSVKACNWEQFQPYIHDVKYGFAEKVNGERCLVSFDGNKLTAYNRRGKLMTVPPSAALYLTQLKTKFVIDGERLMGNYAGHYVAFDILEWDNENITSYSYQNRINILQTAMLQAKLIYEPIITTTYLSAIRNSTIKELTLLVSDSKTENKQQLIVEVKESGGEGIIARKLNTTDIPLKFKFVTDIDAFVFGIFTSADMAVGSLRMGLVRPADNAIIEICHVRSGLTNTNVLTIKEMLANHKYPVFTITYLPARVKSIQLVEPRTNMTLLRNDKTALECTTDQLGIEKADFIAAAQPVSDISLKE